MTTKLVSSTTWYHRDIQVLENFKSNKRAVLNYDLQIKKLYTEIVPAAFQLIERVKKNPSPSIPRIEVKLLNEKHLAENYINQMEKKLGKFSERPIPGLNKQGKYIVKIQLN